MGEAPIAGWNCQECGSLYSAAPAICVVCDRSAVFGDTLVQESAALLLLVTGAQFRALRTTLHGYRTMNPPPKTEPPELAEKVAELRKAARSLLRTIKRWER